MAMKSKGKFKGGLPVEAHAHEKGHIGGPLGETINRATLPELHAFKGNLQQMHNEGKLVHAVRTPTGKPVLSISPKIVMQHVDSRIKTLQTGAKGGQYYVSATGQKIYTK